MQAVSALSNVIASKPLVPLSEMKLVCLFTYCDEGIYKSISGKHDGHSNSLLALF